MSKRSLPRRNRCLRRDAAHDGNPDGKDDPLFAREDIDTRIKLNTERRTVCKHVSLSSLIAVNPDVRRQERNATPSNSDRAQRSERAGRETGPTKKMLLRDRKVVRMPRVKDGGKTGSVRRQGGAAHRVQADPDHDLIGPNGNAAPGSRSRHMRLEKGEPSKNPGHSRSPCRHGLGVDQFCRVDLVGHFRLDAADDKFVVVQASAVTLLIQLELRATEADAILAVVSDPLSVVGLEQLRQVAPEGGLRTRDHRRNFVLAGCHVDAHESSSPDCLAFRTASTLDYGAPAIVGQAGSGPAPSRWLCSPCVGCRPKTGQLSKGPRPRTPGEGAVE